MPITRFVFNVCDWKKIRGEINKEFKNKLKIVVSDTYKPLKPKLDLIRYKNEISSTPYSGLSIFVILKTKYMTGVDNTTVKISDRIFTVFNL